MTKETYKSNLVLMVPDGSRVLDHHGGKHEHTGRHGARIVKRLQLTHKWEGGRE